MVIIVVLGVYAASSTENVSGLAKRALASGCKGQARVQGLGLRV